MKKIKLVCEKVVFYSDFDEDAFFEWLKKISCVSNVEGFGEELYIDINKDEFTEMNLREILALFYRYNVDMKQLSSFLDKSNKEWFFDNEEAFWHKKVFQSEKALST